VQALCKALGVACTAFDVAGDSPAAEEAPRGPGRPRKASGVEKPKRRRKP
jgi:hypothetical protein